MLTVAYSLSHLGHPDICLSLNWLHLSVISSPTHPYPLIHWTLGY